MPPRGENGERAQKNCSLKWSKEGLDGTHSRDALGTRKKVRQKGAQVWADARGLRYTAFRIGGHGNPPSDH